MKSMKFVAAALLLVSVKAGYSQCTAPTVGCSNNNPSNAFLYSRDPKTIEYDNIVSTFHGSMARQSDGTVLVWGEYMNKDANGHVLTPQLMNSTNYPGLTGSVLKFTGGSRNGDASKAEQQYVVLTTTGLFAWGQKEYLLDENLTSSNTFQKITVGGKTDGLPAGVSPANVKMMFGTFGSLTIVTCSGDVYTLVNTDMQNPVNINTVLSTPDDYNAYGDGSVRSEANDLVWHRVKTDASTNLTNVVAVRGGYYSFIALKSDGTLWTWGAKTYLGDGSNQAARGFATQMDALPDGAIPKMIQLKGTYGTVLNSNYYVVATNGKVYSLGANNIKQLGDFTTAEKTLWTTVLKTDTPATPLDGIVWLSVSEHDADLIPAVNALTNTGNIYVWGNSAGGMLGLTPGSYNPTRNPGGLNENDKIMAVVTGGHTSIVIKQCSNQFGYVGHRVNGSMADGTAANAFETTYNFSQTATLNLCAASAAPTAVLFSVLDPVHNGDVLQLDYAPSGGTFNIVSGAATVSPTGVLTLTGTGDNTVIVKYTHSSSCSNTSSQITLNVEKSLSVGFGGINADIANGKLSVNWTSLTETNNDRFEIEASTDGTNFTKIGEVVSKATNGNSGEVISYTFSKDAAAAAAVLGFSLFAIGGLGLGFKRNRKMVFGLVMLAGMATAYAGCTKQDAGQANQDGKLFIRIAQVDKNGAKQYSKTIQAVNKK